MDYSLPFPSPSDFPHPGIDPGFPALQADSLLSGPPGKSIYIYLQMSVIFSKLLLLKRFQNPSASKPHYNPHRKSLPTCMIVTMCLLYGFRQFCFHMTELPDLILLTVNRPHHLTNNSRWIPQSTNYSRAK